MRYTIKEFYEFLFTHIADGYLKQNEDVIFKYNGKELRVDQMPCMNGQLTIELKEVV